MKQKPDIQFFRLRLFAKSLSIMWKVRKWELQREGLRKWEWHRDWLKKWEWQREGLKMWEWQREGLREWEWQRQGEKGTSSLFIAVSAARSSSRWWFEHFALHKLAATSTSTRPLLPPITFLPLILLFFTLLLLLVLLLFLFLLSPSVPLLLLSLLLLHLFHPPFKYQSPAFETNVAHGFIQ